MGLNFIRDPRTSRTVAVSFDSVGIEVPIREEKVERLIQSGRRLGNLIDTYLGDTEIRDLRERIINGQRVEREVSRSERARTMRREMRDLKKQLGTRAKDLRQVCLRARIERSWRTSGDSKQHGDGKERFESEMIFQGKAMASELPTDHSEGWVVGPSLTDAISTHMKWQEKPQVLVRRGQGLIEAIKTAGFAVVVLPWVDSASHILQMIDHLVDLPIMVPSSHMRRVYGKVVKDRT